MPEPVPQLRTWAVDVATKAQVPQARQREQRRQVLRLNILQL